jgi:hypothetical protein
LLTKPVIFVIISFLIALIYSSFITFIVFALPPDPKFGSNIFECKFNGPPPVQTCCWRESVPPGTGNPDLGGDEEQYCQTCNLDQNGDPTECTQKELQFAEVSPTPTPKPFVLPEDGVLQQPTPPPTSPFGPLGGGVLQQPQTSPTPPPLFGRNTANVPLGGGFEVLQESETPPLFGEIAPQGQIAEETQEQASEEQTTEEDEQVIAKDEDDDGPVPPECPTTGPIPPDCTMKPKFPEERAIE